MIKDIIWDFDGTLFNTYPQISTIFKNTLAHFGIDENTDDILANLHQSLWYTYQTYVKKYNLDLETLRKKFSELDEQMDPGFLQPFPGVIEILNNFNGNHFIFTHRGNSTIDYLSHWGLLSHFTEIITRENGFSRKPQPDALLYLIDKYKLVREHTIYIGDRDIDVKCAKNAKIQSCYFNSHQLPIKEIADFEIKDFTSFSFE